MSIEKIIDGLKAVRTIHNGNYAPQIDEAIKLLEQEPILDKIRVEIILNSIEDYKYHGCGSNDLIIETNDVLEIIDKYKAESEG